MAWQYISPEVTVKGFRSAAYPMEWMGRIICCGMTVKRIGMAAVSVRKMKTETVALLGKGR